MCMLIIVCRRVDDDLRSTVTSAMKSTASASKQKLKESQKDAQLTAKRPSRKQPRNVDSESDSDNEDSQKQPGAATRREPSLDFIRHSSSAPKRLNDIVKAPPELKGMFRLARLAEISKRTSSILAKRKRDGDGGEDDDGSDSILSAQQRRMLELEREKAINRYRALKEARLKDSNKTMAST